MELIAGNLLHGLREHATEELLSDLVEGRSFRLERIVSTGQATPPGQWYDQPQSEWVVLLSGAAELQVENEASPRRLSPGDWVLLPAHMRHRVESTSPTEPTVWLALHFAPR